MYNFSEHKQNITQQVTIGNLLLAGILSCKGAWCSQCCEQCRLFLHGLHSSLLEFTLLPLSKVTLIKGGS